MCSVLLCLHVEQPASGSEEGGSQLMQNTDFCMLYGLFTVGCRAREHISMSWIMCDVSLELQVSYSK
jgi:hypothetical protein